VKVQRTSIGLDVHARSVVACGSDGDTGEVFERRLCPNHHEVLEWITGLPGPVAVAYEAGPTGFGLARALRLAGIDCQVARRRSCSARPGIGSRPMSVMQRIWLGCCICVRSWRLRSRQWSKKLPVIWCARGKIAVGICWRHGSVCRNFFCGKGSSIPVGKPGPVSTNCGSMRSAWMPSPCSAPMTRR
jgi:hypothetical protein